MSHFPVRLLRQASICAVLFCSATLAQTATLYGTVTTTDCPTDPRMGMPCMIAPVAGCTITVYTNIDQPVPMGAPSTAIYPTPGGLTAVTDANGQFSLKLDPALARGAQILVNAYAAGYDWYSAVETVSGLARDTVHISLVPATPPVSGTVYSITGTAWASQCPPNPLMGMPCVLEPVPACTLTFYVSTVYYLDDPVVGGGGTPSPSYAPLQAITDANGAYTLTLDPPLAAGTEISVSAVKDGYLPYRNAMILGGDSISLMDVYLDEGSLPPPPEPAGYASVSGTVSYSNPNSNLTVMTPVPNCTVYVYAGAIAYPVYYEVNADGSVSGGAGSVPGSSGSAPADSGVSTGVVYPDQIYSYMAVTDNQGRYSIDSVQIWSDPATNQATFVFSAYKGSIGSAEVNAVLEAGKASTVDLYLQPAPPPPQPVGTATLTGTVLKRSCPSTGKADPQCLLEPVAGCTVLVSAAYVPMMTVRSDAYMPPTVEKTYSAVTDAKGVFTIAGIDLMADGYAVAVMAQKDGLFGSSTATLNVDQTARVEVILDELPYILVDAGGGTVDTVRTAEAAYYAKSAQDLMPAKRPIVKSAAAAPRENVASVVKGSLRLSVPAAQALTIAVYAPDGRKIATLADRRQFAAGTHAVQMPKLTGRAIVRVTGSKGLSATTLAPGR